VKSFLLQHNAFINIKIFIVFITSILISLLFTINPAGTGLFSTILCIAFLTWIIAPYINEKIIIVFLFLFHLLPTLAGIQIAPAIPVFKPQRIAILFMLFYLFRKGYLLEYYSSFFKTKIFTRQIIFIIMSLFISSLLSANKGGTFFYTISFLIEYIFMAVLVFSFFKKDSDIDLLIMLLCKSSLLLCIFGIFERFTQFNFYHLFGDFLPDFVLGHQVRGGAIRISGPFNHSISFGVYLSMTIPFFIYRYNKKPLKLCLSLLLLLITILFTQSRAAIICTALTFLIYCFFINRKMLIACIIILMPVIAFFSGDIFSKLLEVLPFTSTSSEQASSTLVRLQQINFIWEIIKQSIVFGYGQTPPPGMLVTFHLDPQSVIMNNSIDNFYFLYTYYYGFIGLLTWLFLTFSVLIKSIQNVKYNPLLPYLITGIISFTVANSVVALFDFHFLYWIFIGIITRILYNIYYENKRLVLS